MKLKQYLLPLALLGVFSVGAVAPPTASADSVAQKRQKHKNDWRNAAGAAAGVAGYGLLKGNKTATVLGAAGAAYSANRYEQERKHQDAAKRARSRYHRTDRNYTKNGKKYYHYNGHMYWMDTKTGERHIMD